MDLKSSIHTKVLFINEFTEIVNTLKDVAKYVEPDKMNKLVVWEYNNLYEQIKKFGLANNVTFSQLYDIFHKFKTVGYFDTVWELKEYRINHAVDASEMEIANETSDLYYSVIVLEKSLEEIIKESCYNDAEECKLIYKIAKQKEKYMYDLIVILPGNEWDKYIYFIDLYKQLLDNGLKSKLAENIVGIKNIDYQIYHSKGGSDEERILEEKELGLNAKSFKKSS